MPARKDGVDSGDGVALELGHGINLTWVGHIQQVVGDEGLLDRRHLGRANVQASIDLARVG